MLLRTALRPLLLIAVNVRDAERSVAVHHASGSRSKTIMRQGSNNRVGGDTGDRGGGGCFEQLIISQYVGKREENMQLR